MRKPKKKAEPRWRLCSCRENYAPPDTRCNRCLEKEYFKGILSCYDSEDAECLFEMVERNEVLEVVRKLDAEKISLKKRLTNLRKKEKPC